VNFSNHHESLLHGFYVFIVAQYAVRVLNVSGQTSDGVGTFPLQTRLLSKRQIQLSTMTGLMASPQPSTGLDHSNRPSGNIMGDVKPLNGDSSPRGTTPIVHPLPPWASDVDRLLLDILMRPPNRYLEAYMVGAWKDKMEAAIVRNYNLSVPNQHN